MPMAKKIELVTTEALLLSLLIRSILFKVDGLFHFQKFFSTFWIKKSLHRLAHPKSEKLLYSNGLTL